MIAIQVERYICKVVFGVEPPLQPKDPGPKSSSHAPHPIVADAVCEYLRTRTPLGGRGDVIVVVAGVLEGAGGSRKNVDARPFTIFRDRDVMPLEQLCLRL